MRSKRIAKKATWRQSKEIDIDKWYNNAQPDTRTPEQKQYDKEYSRKKKQFMVGLLLIAIIAIIGMLRVG